MTFHDVVTVVMAITGCDEATAKAMIYRANSEGRCVIDNWQVSSFRPNVAPGKGEVRVRLFGSQKYFPDGLAEAQRLVDKEIRHENASGT